MLSASGASNSSALIGRDRWCEEAHRTRRRAGYRSRARGPGWARNGRLSLRAICLHGRHNPGDRPAGSAPMPPASSPMSAKGLAFTEHVRAGEQTPSPSLSGTSRPGEHALLRRLQRGGGARPQNRNPHAPTTRQAPAPLWEGKTSVDWNQACERYRACEPSVHVREGQSDPLWVLRLRMAEHNSSPSGSASKRSDGAECGAFYLGDLCMPFRWAEADGNRDTAAPCGLASSRAHLSHWNILQGIPASMERLRRRCLSHFYD